jgi:hypothetical protein
MWSYVELWARKEKSRFGDFTVEGENSVFSPVVHQGFTATRCLEINVFGQFLLVYTFANLILFEF